MVIKTNNQDVKVEDISKDTKPIEASVKVKSERPKFRNNGPDVKVRLGKRTETAWMTVKHTEVVELPRKLALANKFEEVK